MLTAGIFFVCVNDRS